MARAICGGRRARLAGAACALAVALLGAAVPAAASPAPRLAATLDASPSTLPPPAGTVTLTLAAISGPATCALAVEPAVPLGYRRAPCREKGPLTTVRLPPNAASTPRVYRFTLTATAGRATTTSEASVTVEGSRWRASTVIVAPPGAATALSCANPPSRQPSQGDCVLVGPDGKATVFHRLGGATTSDVDGTEPLRAVSCVPGDLDCVALDAAGNEVVLSHTTWSSPAPFDVVGGVPVRPDAIVCLTLPAPTFDVQCVAADAQGHAYVATFATPTTVVAASVPLAGPTHVACATPALCVVVDRAGRFAVLLDGVWSTHAGVLDAPGGVTSVACAPDHSCLATDSHGGVVGFALRQGTAIGIRRHTTASIVHRSLPALASSCAMAFCLVALGGGVFAQAVGSTVAPAAPAATPSAGSPIAVSCATSATDVWCASLARRSGPSGATTLTTGWILLDR